MTLSFPFPLDDAITYLFVFGRVKCCRLDVMVAFTTSHSTFFAFRNIGEETHYVYSVDVILNLDYPDFPRSENLESITPCGTFFILLRIVVG